MQFQRALVQTLKDRAGSNMTEYIHNYASLTMESKTFVASWKGYDEGIPFWVNIVRVVNELLEILHSGQSDFSMLSTGVGKRAMVKEQRSNELGMTSAKQKAGFFQRMRSLLGFL
jgi:hypothetical protein